MNTATKPSRLPELDILRGFIIVVMALDHANHFIAQAKLSSELWNGTFPNYQSQALPFLTRAITHLAAPGFFFLMGVGMFLFASVRQAKGWSKQQIFLHFAIRGLLLIFIQFVLANRAWDMGSGGSSATYFGVLYALGSCMIIGSFFVLLPARWLLLLSTLLIVCTELFLPTSATGFIQYAHPLRLWLIPGFTEGIYVLYPIMPWLGVMGLGIAYGQWLKNNQKAALRSALWLGLFAILLFIPIRLCNGFGNIRPQTGDDWIAFFNVVKYPPSITFLLLTLGINLTLLGLLSRAPRKVVKFLQPLAVYGRVPLFFYILHLYLYAILGAVAKPQRHWHCADDSLLDFRITHFVADLLGIRPFQAISTAIFPLPVSMKQTLRNPQRFVIHPNGPALHNLFIKRRRKRLTAVSTFYTMCPVQQRIPAF